VAVFFGKKTNKRFSMKHKNKIIWTHYD